MSIHERLETIRLNEKLSRPKFGLLLGKSEHAIYNLERGRAAITPEFIPLVCKTFNINQDWFENGNGNMYDIPDESLELGITFNEIIDSKELSKLMRQIVNLSEKKIKLLSDLVDVMSETEKK